ncbi:AAA family ATPase [Peribacillus simplex]|uniref:ABC transporter ATP-binding protein n=1 Tax=Peribacillus simplex TaxID=1478 RepID=A0AAN2TVB2_9BACI|nr:MULTISPECIES: AAA family ATPase [Bacillaceae]MBD8587538.1 AAA family ATPase [Peribacillus simplex]MCF7624766.1 AAA family ATPase [Peribacillus frigoritolerans]MCT1389691.1 AAA family ATPase [Peribacillus frigoritolerans]MEA3574948.1 AAA family ATPase [Peribacillus frigoritolerans]PRA83653.1 AAA family ATPase [Peribacillus simplex]
MKLDYDSQYIRGIYLNRDRISSYDHFPLDLPVIRHLQEVAFHPSVTYVIGENGMGKSTLLEGIAIAYGFNPEGGTLNFNFSNYDSHSNLDEYLRLKKGVYKPKDHFFFRAETFYNLATNIEELDRESSFGSKIIDSFGGKSLHQQSHGESFFSAFVKRFQGDGLYILDEPEAALSPLRQISMLARINELVQQGSQFIISTHSPIIMAYPDAKILQISDEGMGEVTLEESNHYLLMKQFFEDKDRLLHHLFQ